MRALGAVSLMDFPRHYIVCCCERECARGIPSQEGENIRKPVRGFLQILPCQYPFTVIKVGHKYSYVHMGGLGDPRTTSFLEEASIGG